MAKSSQPTRPPRGPRQGGGEHSTADRLAALRAYLDQWSNDATGEQERSWAILKQALEENRSGYRKLFRD